MHTALAEAQMHPFTSSVRLDSPEQAAHLIAEFRELIRRSGAGRCEAGGDKGEHAGLTACIGIADMGYSVRVEAWVATVPADRLSVTAGPNYLVIRERFCRRGTPRFTALRLSTAIAPETVRATLSGGILRIEAYKKRVMWVEVTPAAGEPRRKHALAACAGR